MKNMFTPYDDFVAKMLGKCVFRAAQITQIEINFLSALLKDLGPQPNKQSTHSFMQQRNLKSAAER